MTDGYVRAQGRSLVDGAGRKLLLRGIGVGTWMLPEGYMFGFKRANSPRLIDEVVRQLVGEEQAREFWQRFRDEFFTRADVAILSRVGFNHVRIPLHYRLFVTDTWPRRLEGPGYQMLDRTLEWCREHGLWVILDLHGAPGGQTGDNIDDSDGYPFLFEDPRSRALTVELWTEIARRYADDPVVAGYELLNEPVATHFDTARLNPLLESLYGELVRAIRGVDSNHLIILGGSRWNTDFSLFGGPPDDNLAYAFHRYWQPVSEKLIEEYLGFSEKWNVPLYMSESGENEDEWVRAFRELLEAHEIGWAFWPYKKIDSTRGPLSIAAPAGWEAIVRFAEHPRTNYAEIREQHPGREMARQTLEELLAAVRLDACEVQGGYLEALGLKHAPGTSRR